MQSEYPPQIKGKVAPPPISFNGKSIAEGGEFMYYCLISAQKFNSSAVAECGYVRPTLCNAMLAVVFYVARAI